MARTRPTPLVDHNRLLQPGHVADAIPVGSPAWYVWLAEATSFSFRSVHGTFTAHKERRGPTREYWKAYRHRAGRLWRVYLGRSLELTLERLNAVAAELAAGGQAPQPPAGAHFARGRLQQTRKGARHTHPRRRAVCARRPQVPRAQSGAPARRRWMALALCICWRPSSRPRRRVQTWCRARASRRRSMPRSAAASG